MSNRRGLHPPGNRKILWRRQKSETLVISALSIPARMLFCFWVPLYHLVQQEDRLACLLEARRVLRPGGLVWGAGISRFASLFDSLSSGFFDDPEFEPILTRDLDEGQHRNSTGSLIYFTDAFFHRPDELCSEFSGAGFQMRALLAIEGPGWLARDFHRLWNDPAQREHLLAAVRKVESEPSVLGASAHIMAIGRK
jgi:hypothetical protein